MGRKETGANLIYEVQLWQMADGRRDSVDAEKCKHVTAACKSGVQLSTSSRMVRDNVEYQNEPVGERFRHRPPINYRVVETHVDERYFNGICR
jgi:hypothetical protein